MLGQLVLLYVASLTVVATVSPRSESVVGSRRVASRFYCSLILRGVCHSRYGMGALYQI